MTDGWADAEADLDAMRGLASSVDIAAARWWLAQVRAAGLPPPSAVQTLSLYIHLLFPGRRQVTINAGGVFGSGPWPASCRPPECIPGGLVAYWEPEDAA